MNFAAQLIQRLSLLFISVKTRKVIFYILCGSFLILIVAIRPPSNFPTKSILTVREKATVSEVAQYLKDQHAITSISFFKSLIRLLNPENGVLSGDYYFAERTNLFTVAYRISRADFGLEPVSLTVPEGSNVFQIADLAKQAFPKLDSEEFIKLSKDREGYLFPDTYYFLPNIHPEDMLHTMEENFKKKIGVLEGKIREFGKPLRDVLIMASYLEEEARLMHTRRMIAGILWKRLEIDMPLQIDATFQYVNGKNTYQLTTEDLKIDSPYNTYVYKGLTPGPISNPGLEAIEAAVTPISSKYFYFLSDRSGTMHYAVTHDEHVANKARYLK